MTHFEENLKSNLYSYWIIFPIWLFYVCYTNALVAQDLENILFICLN